MPVDKNVTLTEGISHVALTVSNLPATLAFFEALGFYKTTKFEEENHSLFITDGSCYITLWQTRENANPFDGKHNVGLHHLSIRVPSKDALKEAYESVLRVEGVKSDFGPEELRGSPFTRAMVCEPSGNKIELTYHSQSQFRC